MFHENLKEARKNKNITQAQIAEKLSIATSTYGDYERGRTEPDLKTLKKIAMILNVSVDALLNIKTDDGKFKKIKKEDIEKIIELLNK